MAALTDYAVEIRYPGSTASPVEAKNLLGTPSGCESLFAKAWAAVVGTVTGNVSGVCPECGNKVTE